MKIYDNTIECCKLVLDIQDDNAKAYLRKGKALRLQNNHEDSIDCLKAGLVKNENHKELTK